MSLEFQRRYPEHDLKEYFNYENKRLNRKRPKAFKVIGFKKKTKNKLKKIKNHKFMYGFINSMYGFQRAPNQK